MSNQNAALRAQMDQEWNYWMTQYPELATALGYPGQNARWTDYSAEAIDARESRLKESAGKLSQIDPARLSGNDRINFDLYSDALDSALSGLELHNDATPIKGVIPHNLFMPM